MSIEADNSFNAMGRPMRRFYLNRVKDETGVSRTGRVLEGVITQSGRVITEWRPPHSSVGIYKDLAEFKLIHIDCHPSCSEIVWLDPDEYTDPQTGQRFRERLDGGYDLVLTAEQV